MPNNPIISVIMPVYNVEFYIDEAIKSILSQTYQQFELIIIEDGSTDQTPQIIKSFSDPRITIITNEINLGISASLNRGLDYSKGLFIARADGDDVSFYNRLAIQMKHLKEKKVDLVCSNYLNENVETGEVTENCYREFPPNETKSHLFFYDITHGTVMFKRKIISNIKHVYENTPAEDFDLFVRLAQNYIFYNIPENLVKVRIRQDSLCGKGSNIISKDIDRIRLKQLQDFNINPTDDEGNLHRALINRDYRFLSTISLNNIYKWIGKIVKVNNQRKSFPNPYFNNEWQLRVSHSLKYREKRTIRNVINYLFLTKLLGHKSHLRNLIYLYKYKHSFNY